MSDIVRALSVIFPKLAGKLDYISYQIDFNTYLKYNVDYNKKVECGLMSGWKVTSIFGSLINFVIL